MPIGKRAAMQAAEATDRICCVIEHLMQRKLHAKFNEKSALPDTTSLSNLVAAGRKFDQTAPFGGRLWLKVTDN
jgi:hypothetical protein